MICEGRSCDYCVQSNSVCGELNASVSVPTVLYILLGIARSSLFPYCSLPRLSVLFTAFSLAVKLLPCELNATEDWLASLLSANILQMYLALISSHQERAECFVFRVPTYYLGRAIVLWVSASRCRQLLRQLVAVLFDLFLVSALHCSQRALNLAIAYIRTHAINCSPSSPTPSPSCNLGVP